LLCVENFQIGSHKIFAWDGFKPRILLVSASQVVRRELQEPGSMFVLKFKKKKSQVFYSMIGEYEEYGLYPSYQETEQKKYSCPPSPGVSRSRKSVTSARPSSPA
jgi:hypothetical protein